MNKKIKHLRFFVLGLIVIAVICVPLIPKFTVKDILNYRPESLLLAALELIGLFCLKSVMIVIPLVVLYVAAGIIFPPGWAIAITYLGLTLEMTIGFFIGRLLGRTRVIALINKSDHAKKIMEFGCNNSLLSCFLIRFIPGPPFDLTNMFIGTTDVKYPQYIFGTLLGLTPGMIPLVLLGDAAADPFSPEFLIFFTLSMMLTFFFTVGYHIWRKKTKTRINND